MPAGLSTVCLDGMHQHCSNLMCGWGPVGAGWVCVVVPADLSMLVGLVCMLCIMLIMSVTSVMWWRSSVRFGTSQSHSTIGGVVDKAFVWQNTCSM